MRSFIRGLRFFTYQKPEGLTYTVTYTYKYGKVFHSEISGSYEALGCAHNLKAAGSNPAPATNLFNWNSAK